PQPVVVIEIGIALAADTAGAMAGRAVIGKRRFALRAGEVEQLRVGGDLLQRGLGELVRYRTSDRLELREVGNDGAARMPAERALGRRSQQRPGRIDDPV